MDEIISKRSVMTRANRKKTGFVLFMLTVFILLSGWLTGTVSAFDTRSASPYAETINNYDEAYTKMYLAMYNMETRLDLSELKIRDNEIMRIYSDIRNNSPELFYLQNSLLYYYNAYGYVTSVEFSYTMTGDELAAARAQYDAELAYIASLTGGCTTDVEIALFVHDYFAASFSYDDSMNIYDAYGLLTTRTGVCQAYSLAYAAVLRECGIDAVMVTSEEMNHAWNLVKINGSWYHVDISYDDPSPDRLGMVLHENFLLSDNAVRENHYGWTSILRCRSTLYDGAYWRNISSKMTCIDGSWYYIDEKKEALIRSDYTGAEQHTIYTFDNKWYVSPDSNSFWKGCFSGCANYLSYLYFNTPDEIMVYSTTTGGISTLTANDDKKTDFYGLTIYQNTLEYVTADRPDHPNISNTHTFQLMDFSLDGLNATLPFEDVPRLSKYYTAVRFVYNNNLFYGVSATEFSLKTEMTRAMFITVLGRLCGIDPDLYDGTSFDDVAEGIWYAPYVKWGVESGIVNGIGNNLFDPDGAVTHEQMYKFVFSCARYLNCDNTEVENVLMIYVDRKQISDWAYEGIAYCHANRLISEDFSAYLKPKKEATRAEVAELIYRFASTILTPGKH